MKDLLHALVFGGLFLIPFLPLYVEDAFFFPFITGKNFAFRIIIEVVFASWILLALYDPKYRPKFSWILSGFAVFLAIMAVANMLGEYPPKSFWSNFERMDGYVTLVHVFMYTVVLGSVMTTEKLWTYFMHTTVVVALFVALYGLAQFGGLIEGGRARVDSRLGNAAYMAIYMLFHIFFIFWLFVRSKVTTHRVLYAVVGVIFVYTLLQTGTRGTFLGFLGGSTAMVVYIALFARKYAQFRKISIGSLIALVILIGGFIALKDTSLIPEAGPIKRIANISLEEDLQVRMTIWNMAIEGVKERPLLGWGQGNFNYVFNEHFDPSIYAAESWFDRTHNIFLDWLIAGGVLGLLGYFSIMLAAVYYVFWQPMFRKEQAFTVLERGVLIGLIVGYLMHNLVVFDNIISYIFYGTILALIHSRAGEIMERVNAWRIDERLITQFAMPVIILITATTVYIVNMPNLFAAGDIIDALTESTVEGRLQEFHNAIERKSFGDQEIVEQLAQNAMNIVRNQNFSETDKRGFVQRAELELLRLVEEKPNDARLHSFLSSFYRSIGALPQSQEQARIARDLSPKKQAIIIEQGIIELQLQNFEGARDFFKEAFELDESNTNARILYTATMFYTGEQDEAIALIGEEHKVRFAQNDFALSAVDQFGSKEYLAELFEALIEAQPDNAQHRASLAFIYNSLGDVDKAIAVLEAGGARIPAFNSSAQCFIENLKNGNEPNEGCE